MVKKVYKVSGSTACTDSYVDARELHHRGYELVGRGDEIVRSRRRKRGRASLSKRINKWISDNSDIFDNGSRKIDKIEQEQVGSAGDACQTVGRVQVEQTNLKDHGGGDVQLRMKSKEHERGQNSPKRRSVQSARTESRRFGFRDETIWKVKRSALRYRASSRIEHLSQPKLPPPEFMAQNGVKTWKYLKRFPSKSFDLSRRFSHRISTLDHSACCYACVYVDRPPSSARHSSVLTAKQLEEAMQRLSRAGRRSTEVEETMKPKKVSEGSGVSVAALKYKPTDRIRKLSQPKRDYSLN